MARNEFITVGKRIEEEPYFTDWQYVHFTKINWRRFINDMRSKAAKHKMMCERQRKFGFIERGYDEEK